MKLNNLKKNLYIFFSVAISVLFVTVLCEKINLPSNTSTFHLKKIKTLSKWREEKAIINNIPKSWIFNDRELIKIATAKKNKLDYVLSSLKHEISSKDISYIKDICKNDIETH